MINGVFLAFFKRKNVFQSRWQDSRFWELSTFSKSIYLKDLRSFFKTEKKQATAEGRIRYRFILTELNWLMSRVTDSCIIQSSVKNHESNPEWPHLPAASEIFLNPLENINESSSEREYNSSNISSLCLTQTDTEPTSHTEVILNRTASGEHFHHFLLDKKAAWDFVLSNSVEMLFLTGLFSALENNRQITLHHTVLCIILSCIISPHMYFCTTQSSKNSHFSLRAHTENDDFQYKIDLNVVLDGWKSNKHLVLLHNCVRVHDSVHNIYQNTK